MINFKIFLFLFVSILPIRLHAETIDRIVAKVGNDIITVSDTTDTLKLKKKLLLLKYGKIDGARRATGLENDFINEMILEIILKEKIEEEGFALPDKELETYYQSQLQSQNKTEKEFLAELQNQNITLKEYKDDLKFEIGKQKFVQKNISPKIQIAETDLQKAYEVKKGEFKTFKKYHFIETMLARTQFPNEAEFKKTAETIQAGLRSNSPTVAVTIRKHSQGAFKNNGGDSGIMDGKDINPEIKILLDQLKDGQTSQVFYNPGAAYIFKLIQKSDPQPLAFNEVVGTLKMQLAQEAINKELRNYLLAQKEKTFVEILPAQP